MAPADSKTSKIVSAHDSKLVDILFSSALDGEYVRDQISGTFKAFNSDEHEPIKRAAGSLDDKTVAELKKRELRAIAAAESGQIDDAVQQLSEIIDKHPTYAPAYNNRAQAYRLQNVEFDMVITDLNSAIEHASDDQTLGQAFTQKGIVLRERGDQDGAFYNFSQGAKCGNEVAKMAASKENPYAKLCGRMVSQAMKQLRMPETHK
ncbi:hypothetical protein IWW54_002961 [Coemansia sp. RSA 2705]|nr:hypothetical protein IWW54_002961 [Coemansia sp. RSA 2705]